MERRHFLLGSAAFAAGARGFGAPSDTVRIGLTGIGGRGRGHLRSFGALENVEIAAICDIDQAHAEQAAALIQKSGWKKPESYVDVRKMLENKSLDAIAISAPNHWHTLMTVWACQAGKHVYVEKPVSHSIWEGRKMVEAARKYNRMVQIGSQNRSVPGMIKGVQLLKEGVIGKVYMAKGLCFKRRKSIGKTPVEPVPPGLNWDLFLGPAPMRPYTKNRFAYNWHWFWDTGDGDIGNQGIHEMDKARWGLGRELPTLVSSTGGKYVYDDDQETPNTQLASYDYGDCQIVFEVRGIITGGESGAEPRGNNTVSNIFYGADGYMVLEGGGFKVYKGENRELAMEEKPSRADAPEHMANFLAAIKTRKHTDLNADVEVGAKSMALVHMANISYRLRRTLKFDPATMTFPGDAEANRLARPEQRKPYAVPDKV